MRSSTTVKDDLLNKEIFMVDLDAQELDELSLDESTLAEDEDQEALIIQERRIFTDKHDYPIGSLYTKYKDGELILDPIFQRRPVWDRARSSRLIESVLLEVPLPVFYLAESSDSSEEVIDGQQRLRAFFSFIDGEYSLTGLKALPDLNDKRYQGLDRPLKRKIRDYPLHTVTFKKESDENLRFEIFERLNTGAVPLNYQELRNCIYRGPYNDLLISLSSDADFMALMGLKAPEKRMHDVEYVLRFAAFYHATYLKYKPSMATFLNEDMKQFQKITKDESDKLRNAFKTSVALLRSMLGANAFRRYYRGVEGSHAGYWEPKKFNASLYDIMMWGFSDKDKNQVMANLDPIREAWIVLMTEDDRFIESIELSTSSIKSVTYRFDAWRKALGDILDKTTKQPRFFTRDLKEQLYKDNPTCKICNQRISDVDDAAVDHVKQYWLGGKTEFENARLTHRYCNWARSKSDIVA
jgi:hypothetical protein